MAQSRWLNNKQDAYWQLSNDNDLNSSAITQNPCSLYGFFLAKIYGSRQQLACYKMTHWSFIGCTVGDNHSKLNQRLVVGCCQEKSSNGLCETKTAKRPCYQPKGEYNE